MRDDRIGLNYHARVSATNVRERLFFVIVLELFSEYLTFGDELKFERVSLMI